MAAGAGGAWPRARGVKLAAVAAAVVVVVVVVAVVAAGDIP